LTPGLYVTATPIGNIGDASERMRRTLAAADLVVCEDTRVTGGLLTRLGAKARLLAYHDHNAAQIRPQVLERLTAGAAVALVSDAGTPLVSDPGYRLVREAQERGHRVFAVPGPSAVMAALVVAGLPTDRFLFAGFLPAKPAARRRTLKELAAIDATLVLFEAPSRLGQSLAAMAEAFGARDAAVCRELTKLFEEVRRAPLGQLAAAYAEGPPPKGEIVVVVGPPAPAAPASDLEVEALLRQALAGHSLREAVDRVSAATGRPRREVYRAALGLRDDG
jgi:16S rRNA (cytidine1402-2'-O)-methyltransferase